MRLKNLVLIGGLVASGCAAPTGMKADAGPHPENYEEIIKTYLHDHLKDPYNVQELTITKPTPTTIWTGILNDSNVNLWMTCVGYNAKNSYGGYVGVKYYSFPIRYGSIVTYPTRDFVNPGC
jgi:hypothetical protein